MERIKYVDVKVNDRFIRISKYVAVNEILKRVKINRHKLRLYDEYINDLILNIHFSDLKTKIKKYSNREFEVIFVGTYEDASGTLREVPVSKYVFIKS